MLKATQKQTQKGFSLIELVIVLVIGLIILGTIGFRTSGAVSNLEVEAVASEIALAVYQAKEQASKGNADVQKRTFDLEKALARPHKAVRVATSPIVQADNKCKTSCDDLESKLGESNSICISDNKFCFNAARAFTFDRFSGRLTNSHVIFISSDKRNLALLISKEGDHYIAELVNNTWQTQRDLQKLFPTENTKTNEGKLY